VIVRVIPSENCLDAGGKLLHIEGLYYEIVSSKLKTENLVENLALCRYHDNGLLGNLADLAAYLIAVLLGKHNVKENEIGLVDLKVADALSAVKGALYLIAFVFEIKAEKLANVGIVIDNKNFCTHLLIPFSEFFRTYIFIIP